VAGGRWGSRLRTDSARTQLRVFVLVFSLALSLTVVAAVLLAQGLAVSTRTRAELDQVNVTTRQLREAYADEMTGAGGYVIGGDLTLRQRYTAGLASEAHLVSALRSDLADDPRASAALEQTLDAVGTWRTEVQQALEVRDDVGDPVDTGIWTRVLLGYDDVVDAQRALQHAVDSRETAQVSAVRGEQSSALYLLLASLALTALTLAVTVRRFSQQVMVPLVRLARDADVVAGGDLGHELRTGGVTELRVLGDSVAGMRDRLLEERSLAARRSLLIGQEDERRRLAMGIHDDSVQAVLAASLRLQRLRRQLREGDPDMVLLVQQVQTDLEEAINRLRRMIFELHPPTLDRDGLESAMRLYLGETLDPAGIGWTLRHDGKLPKDPVTTSLVYRLFREAALNVLRHSDADRVDVRLQASPEQVQIELTDDGVGFDPAVIGIPVPGHLGLLASRQLCEAAGGRWQVDSAPGRGTTVRFTVPLSVQ